MFPLRKIASATVLLSYLGSKMCLLQKNATEPGMSCVVFAMQAIYKASYL